nr:MAG TPA: hypothetical protein [Caudoviricetes sp.]
MLNIKVVRGTYFLMKGRIILLQSTNKNEFMKKLKKY